MTHIWIEKAKVEQALEALEQAINLAGSNSGWRSYYVDRYNELSEAIATEESSVTQEPVADLEDASFDELLEHYWQIAYAEGQTGKSYGDKANEVLFRLRSLYTHPQTKREWVGLTDEEHDELIRNAEIDEMGNMNVHDVEEFARSIEAKLKEKNT